MKTGYVAQESSLRKYRSHTQVDMAIYFVDWKRTTMSPQLSTSCLENVKMLYFAIKGNVPVTARINI